LLRNIVARFYIAGGFHFSPLASFSLAGGQPHRDSQTQAPLFSSRLTCICEMTKIIIRRNSQRLGFEAISFFFDFLLCSCHFFRLRSEAGPSFQQAVNIGTVTLATVYVRLPFFIDLSNIPALFQQRKQNKDSSLQVFAIATV
jgi:hypothetical protein